MELIFFVRMSAVTVIICVVAYFAMLFGISFLTGKENSNEAFFLGNKKSPWYIVAFGMIGTSLSGVTFISVPGWVAKDQFSYMPMVLGYVVGYLVIATILMPLYYRLNLTSIYTYLEQRFGQYSYKTGALYFLLSRVMGAAFRLYLVAIVLDYAVFSKLGWNVPFAVTVMVTIALIWLYTFRGGIKTIIWTDTLQTFFMLSAVGLTVYLLSKAMNLGPADVYTTIRDSEYSQVFFFDDWNDKRHFVKRFLAGVFITIVMTGLDQDMMQKNLSCRNVKEAQKNVIWMSGLLVIANLLFLSLGALLYIFAVSNNIDIPAKADELYPMLALDGYLSPIVGIFFVLGLIAAAYSSADSALAALTTSFCIDFLNIQKRPEAQQVRLRKMVHIGFSVLLVGVILIFQAINDDSVISELFTAAGYTYGPLLGLFAFGIFTNWAIRDKWVWVICLASPVLCYILQVNSELLLGGYKFGFELLILNGALTFIGLLAISRGRQAEIQQ